MGHLEEAALVLRGSRKGSLDVAEELAFQQGFRKSSAVDGDKRFGGARRAGMDGAGHQFLARAAVAVDQHGAVGGGHGANSGLQALHAAADADNVFQRVASGGIALQGKILAAKRLLGKGLAHGDFHVFDQAGALAQVVEGTAGLDGLHGGFQVIDGGDEHDGSIRRNAVGVAQHFDAVGFRHADVGDDDVEQSRFDLLLGGFAGGDGFDFVAFLAENEFQHLADGALVIAHQNVTHATPFRRQ